MTNYLKKIKTKVVKQIKLRWSTSDQLVSCQVNNVHLDTVDYHLDRPSLIIWVRFDNLSWEVISVACILFFPLQYAEIKIPKNLISKTIYIYDQKTENAFLFSINYSPQPCFYFIYYVLTLICIGNDLLSLQWISGVMKLKF